MAIKLKDFRDMMRDVLNPEKVRTSEKINCSEVEVKEDGNKMVLSYMKLDENKLIEMEYIDGLLNRIYINGEIDFDYNAEN